MMMRCFCVLVCLREVAFQMQSRRSLQMFLNFTVGMNGCVLLQRAPLRLDIIDRKMMTSAWHTGNMRPEHVRAFRIEQSMHTLFRTQLYFIIYLIFLFIKQWATNLGIVEFILQFKPFYAFNSIDANNFFPFLCLTSPLLWKSKDFNAGDERNSTDCTVHVHANLHTNAVCKCERRSGKPYNQTNDCWLCYWLSTHVTVVCSFSASTPVWNNQQRRVLISSI